MVEDFPTFHARPTREQPLAGITALLVEDSRCASEAMRLLALKSGARLRRADSLAAAHRHLSVYRPMLVIVDMGLPDGSGAELIGTLARAEPRVPVLLGTSGDPGAEAAAMAAGADGFLAKPVESLAAFQQAVIAALPEGLAPSGPRALPQAMVGPDPRALAGDLEQAAKLMRAGDAQSMAYAAQFLGAVARSAHDSGLEAAAQSLTGHGGGAPARRVARLVASRLAEMRTPA
ncbi:MAG: response regulator [Maritimibacter sp.]|nr:response regulator [Maritimibacter sp.]